MMVLDFLKPSDEFWVSIGILLGSLLVLLFFNLQNHVGLQLSIQILCFAYCYIRSVEFINNFLLQKTQDTELSFAASFFIPFFLILCLGILNFSISLNFFTLFFIFDIFFILIFFRFNEINFNYRNLIFGIFIASLLSFISLFDEGRTPWSSLQSIFGVGYGDDFRDAAIINSWVGFQSISHGIHGLTYHPYNFLSVLFFSPFLHDDNNIFEIFFSFSQIFCPAVIIFGLIKLIKLSSSTLSRNWKLLIFCFVFTFAYFFSIQHSRSVFTASFLMVSFIPLVISLWINRNTQTYSIILISFILPLLVLARVFHGLIALGIVAPLIFYRKRKSEKVFILLSSLISSSILIFYYGSSLRNASSFDWLGPIRIIKDAYDSIIVYDHALIEGSLGLIIGLILIFISLIFLTDRKNLFKIDHPLILVIIFTILSLFIGSLKALGYSDRWYLALPSIWIIFFIFLNDDFRYLVKKNFYGTLGFSLESTSVKLLLVFLTMISYWDLISHKLELHRDGASEKFIYAKSLNMKLDYGIANLIGKNTNKYIKAIDGNSALYLHPDHEYWDLHFSKPAVSSLYFMAIHGFPLFAGALDIDEPAYSYPAAKSLDGLLVDFNIFDDSNKLCQIADKIKIRNIIFNQSYESKFLRLDCLNKEIEILEF